ncbi:MAG: phosphoribosylformimino-5-aminoimidazole carboxamide ribotide isomerase [Eubacteriales bacterium]|nr:phosphoribosylformimino-5-aminoimidazole carboxamide ribotide isomerase [Eubacteriales bacterium]
MKLRPCIDIHGGRVKQIVGGSIRHGHPVQENFVSEQDAAGFASLYREKKLAGGHIILLDSAASDPEAYAADCAQARGALAAFPGGMQVGGGITAENAGGWLRAGASHVIVTSYVFRGGMLDEERLAELQRAVGKDRLVLDLSCRRLPDGRFVVVTDRWQRFTKWEITPENLQALCARCDEFLIHAADVEGKRGGIQEDLVRILGDFCLQTGFPVTYAGGIRDAGDLERIASLSGGSLDATVGSALRIFGGSLDLDVLAAAAEAM